MFRLTLAMNYYYRVLFFLLIIRKIIIYFVSNRGMTYYVPDISERVYTPVNVGNEYVQESFIMATSFSPTGKTSRRIPVSRHIENVRRSFWSIKNLVKGKLPLSLQRKIMDMYILPILTYDIQTWSLTDRLKFAPRMCQRGMERCILGINLSDHVRVTIGTAL